MSKENIRKWVDALRSGEYEQATGQLRTNKGFCCLGVACDLYGEENDVTWGRDDGFIGRIDLPPSIVGDWLGIGSPNPVLAYISYEDPEDPDAYTITPGGNQISEDAELRASELNDDYGWAFDQIADAIEATYLT